MEDEKANDLQQQADQLMASYRARLSKSAFTAIASLVAVVGFLINSHHMKLVRDSPIEIIAVYLALLCFGLVIVFETICVRIESHSTGTRSRSRSAATKKLPVSDQTGYSKELHRLQERLKMLQLWAEVLATLGAVSFIVFGMLLLSHALQLP